VFEVQTKVQVQEGTVKSSDTLEWLFYTSLAHFLLMSYWNEIILKTNRDGLNALSRVSSGHNYSDLWD
jgi:hypothetical protein